MTHRPPDRRLRRFMPRRFVVEDRSMEPALRSGQGLVTRPTARAKVGQLRCVEHPDRPGLWLVKRVESLPTPDTMNVASDNNDVATVDSRQFGPVPVAGSYRVVFAIPLRLM